MVFKVGDKVTAVGNGCGKCSPCSLAGGKTGTITEIATDEGGNIRFYDVLYDEITHYGGTHCTGFKKGHIKLVSIENWKAEMEGLL